MHNSKLKQLPIAVLLAILPIAADAAGLGKLTVNSGLGEPLNAEIELVSTTPDEMASISASIASEEAYSAQGLEKSSIHNGIRVEVTKKGLTPVLKLSSSQPIADPFLDMLIQVDWATGRLVREYTVLLDPPGYNASQAATTSVSAPEVKSPTIAKTASTSSLSSSSSSPTSSANAPASGDYTTRKGDTLAKVAKELQVQDVNLDQMLVGLYRANKEAFLNENMNRLKVGQIIKVPTASDLQSISAEEAKKEIRAHSSDWNAYRQKLADSVGAESKSEKSPINESETPAQNTGKGKITAATEDKSTPKTTEPKDVVKLSKGDASDKKAADSSNVQAMKDKLNALQEESVAREKSVKEASERVSALEKQVSDLQKLLAMKDQTLSQLQKNAESASKKPAEPSAPPVAEVKPQPEPEKVELPQEKPAEAKAPEATEAKPVPAEAAKPEPVKTDPSKVEPAPVAPEEPNMVDGILGSLDPVLIGGGVGALALLAGGWTFLRNKRRRNLDNFEKGILTAGGLKANTVFGNTAGGTVDTGDTSFLTDFSQSINGMIDTHDVDPIAEAEVYMAYGREAQAEEILNDAIAKDPTRYELHQKLLEIYAGRSDISAFEAIAGELYSTLGATHPVWAKVAEMGRKLEPDNPLYDLSEAAAATLAFDSVAAGTASLAPEKSADLPLEASDFESAEVMDSSLDFTLDDAPQAEQASQEEALDFDFAGTDVSTEIVEEEDSESALEFDLGSTDEAVSPVLEQEVTAENDLSLDFPLDLGADTSISADEEETADELSFDLGAEVNEEQPASQDTAIDFAAPELSLSASSVETSMPSEVEDISEATESTLDFDLPTIGDAPAPENDLQVLPDNLVSSLELPAESVTTEEVSTGSGLDFNFDMSLPDISGEVAEAVSEAPEISLSEMNLPSLELDNLNESSADSTNVPEVVTDIESFAQDDSPEDKSSLTNDTDAPVEIDLGEISLDLTEADPVEEISLSADVSESEDVNTKLDLVSAYMEMGDHEGARELLEEVIKEGGPSQKAKAEKLLAELM